jgi:hypothetical protein
MESKPPNRFVAIAIGIVAAGCLATATFMPTWLASAGNDVRIGLPAIWHDATLLPDASPAFEPCGWATFVLCLAAAGGLAIAALLAIAGARIRLPIAPTTIAFVAIVLALITGCVFVATKPGAAGYVGVGLGFWVFGIGSVVGIAAAQMLAKVNRPLDPDLMEGAMNPDQF